jgi:hypothetical protein
LACDSSPRRIFGYRFTQLLVGPCSRSCHSLILAMGYDILIIPPPLGYEEMEPPPGADPGHPPYEGGAAAVRGGVASGAGLEPARAGFRALLGTPAPHPEPSAEGAIRTHRPRGLSSRGLPVAFTPAWCAARASNSVPLGKSQVHHPSCLQRVVSSLGASYSPAGVPPRLADSGCRARCRLHRRTWRPTRADSGNRTRVACLEGTCLKAIRPYPRGPRR